MKLKIYEDSKNYTCQVIKLPHKVPVAGLDNLVQVSYQGNDCLIGKDSNPDELYLFFPAECQLSQEFLSRNNLFRHSELNADKDKKGFFEDSGRVKAIKFKGVISTGFIIPINSLKCFNNFYNGEDYIIPKVGDEFNEFNGIEVCRKYIKPKEKQQGMSNPKTKVLDNIVDSKFAPQHFDTAHLLKNTHKLNLNDYIAITYKLHGTSARYFNTLVKRSLTWKDKLAKWFGVIVDEEYYDYICASRQVIKSCGFEELPNKNHYYNDNLWSAVGKEYFENRLKKGEAIYCEIVGKTYNGSPIQGGYTYGFEKPEVFIYRISNINYQGLEVDLSYHQMKQRAEELGVKVCPELFYGTLSTFILNNKGNISISEYPEFSGLENELTNIFYNKLLEKPSILDKSVVEEGFCVRIDKYPKPDIFKIKSKKFLEHETKALDKEEINMEENA